MSDSRGEKGRQNKPLLESFHLDFETPPSRTTCFLSPEATYEEIRDENRHITFAVTKIERVVVVRSSQDARRCGERILKEIEIRTSRSTSSRVLGPNFPNLLEVVFLDFS